MYTVGFHCWKAQGVTRESVVGFRAFIPACTVCVHIYAQRHLLHPHTTHITVGYPQDKAHAAAAASRRNFRLDRTLFNAWHVLFQAANWNCMFRSNSCSDLVVFTHIHRP
jgi:hypothetical protein